ncbi:MAG: flavodoxin-dependent (E)-4-hydroxy-3-methylbut-2-enyl-diphosphate synthase [Planctomycetota bacterium]
MSECSESISERRRTRSVSVGDVQIGGGAPISVQSMTKTHTRNVDGTLAQIGELAERGCQIIRCAVPTRRAIEPFGEVAEKSALPVIADIHFDPSLALLALEAGADGVRVNPPTISDLGRLTEVYAEAGRRGTKVRIGINSGSVRARKGLEVEELEAGDDMARLMVEQALRCCEEAEKAGCPHLVVSLKASDVPTTLRAYRMAANRCDYPFHVGVTAAGPPNESLVRSAVGIGTLLAEGIGDTIRVSMTGPPHEEVDGALQILHALGLRPKQGPRIVSCPTCGRCNIDLRSLVDEVQEELRGCEKDVTVAVMGCVVNGPGEAAEADLGVAGGKDCGYVFRNGQKIAREPASRLAAALLSEIENL